VKGSFVSWLVAMARSRLSQEHPWKKRPCGRRPLTKENAAVVLEPNATAGDFHLKGCDHGTDKNKSEVFNCNEDGNVPAWVIPRLLSFWRYRTKVLSERDPEGRCNADLKYKTLLSRIN